MSQIRQKAIEGLEFGDTFCVSRTFSKKDVIQFADISGDFNPIHFDPHFAKAKKFDGCICQGLLVGSILTEIGGQIGWLGTEISLFFKKPVYINDTVTCTFTITSIDKKGYAIAKAVFTNQHHLVVLKAILKGFPPGDKDKKLMNSIP
jgi:3-hydroxybutyryl-CoA dehydratase